MTPKLTLRGIHKRFGSVQAVHGADFSVMPGEIHVLLGENGAGKSTLMRVAAGIVFPDRGEILVDGVLTLLQNPRDARRAGIGMVHQHSTSIPAFTIRDNVALSCDWPLRPAELDTRIEALNRQLGFSLDPTARAETLPVAGLQRLEILKVMAARGTILILDEPTGSLSPTDAADLLTLVRRLVDRGSGAVLITHKLDEALRFGDRVTVLRRGQVALSGPIAGRSAADLAHAMLGESLSGHPLWENVLPGSVVVSAEEITIPPFGGSGPGIRSGTFQIRSGETVGVAAVEGNGERELLRAVAGLLPIASGKLTVGQPVTLVPEDRTGEGLVGQFTLAENFTLGLGHSASWVRHGLINRSAARVEAASLLQRYEIIAAGPDALAGTLSGGNQQKLVLARALEQHPRVLVAENPGRGLDIRAAQACFAKMRASAKAGAGVIIHSSDLDELLDWCDRILVVAQGRIHVPPREASRETLGRLLLGIQG